MGTRRAMGGDGEGEGGRGIHQSQEEVITQRAKNMVTRHMSHAGHMTHVSELRMVTCRSHDTQHTEGPHCI